MKRTNAFATINQLRSDARLPTAHPPPRAGSTPFRVWDATRDGDSAGAQGDGLHEAVAINSTVEIRDLDSDELEVYTLVHPSEADILRNRISSFTPIGRALFGRRAGEVVEVAAPRGAVRIRIERVRGPSKHKVAAAR